MTEPTTPLRYSIEKPRFRGKKHGLREVLGGLRLLLRHRPPLLLYYGVGIGDNLLCTTIAREYARRALPPIWMLSDYPVLFAGNPDIGGVVPDAKLLRSFAKRNIGQVLCPHYASAVPEEDREIALRPYYAVPAPAQQSGRRVPNQIAIQSSGLGWPIPVKEWFPERFQRVVDLLKARYGFVQIGAVSDPLLSGALDLRGQTSVPETAAILAQSRLFVGQVGFLMHLARAVDCPAVIVYGGREHPVQSGYICNRNLFTPLPCSPCWRRNSCPIERECMRQIEPESVARAIESQLARSRVHPWAPLEAQSELLCQEGQWREMIQPVQRHF